MKTFKDDVAVKYGTDCIEVLGSCFDLKGFMNKLENALVHPIKLKEELNTQLETYFLRNEIIIKDDSDNDCDMSEENTFTLSNEHCLEEYYGYGNGNLIHVLYNTCVDTIEDLLGDSFNIYCGFMQLYNKLDTYDCMVSWAVLSQWDYFKEGFIEYKKNVESK